MNDNVKIEKIKELARLLKNGVISESEFERLKKQIIESEQTEEQPKTVERKTTIEKLPIIFALTVASMIVFQIYYDTTKGNSQPETILHDQSDSPENSESNSYTYQEQVNQNQKKECYRCKGAGIITCTMCNGTGINNMGTECGCVTYVANCRTMGKEPTRTALQWTCEHCNGTGYEK